MYALASVTERRPSYYMAVVNKMVKDTKEAMVLRPLDDGGSSTMNAIERFFQTNRQPDRTALPTHWSDIPAAEALTIFTTRVAEHPKLQPSGHHCIFRSSGARLPLRSGIEEFAKHCVFNPDALVNSLLCLSDTVIQANRWVLS
jgi:hypothetical protein